MMSRNKKIDDKKREILKKVWKVPTITALGSIEIKAHHHKCGHHHNCGNGPIRIDKW